MSGAEDLRVVVRQGTEAFLRAWNGDPAEDAEPTSGEGPEPLRAWWRWERSWGSICHQNQVLTELDLSSSPVVFYVENQAVVEWGFDPDTEEVFERVTDGRSDWEPVGSALADFLLQVAVFEAVLGSDRMRVGRASWAVLDLPGLDVVGRPMSKTVVAVTTSAAAVIAADADGEVHVFAAPLLDGDFAPFGDLVDWQDPRPATSG